VGGFLEVLRARSRPPNLTIWTEDGWIVENEGVAPDVEVEPWPAAVAAGKDPRLEKAAAFRLKRPDFSEHDSA
jgi:tricorn protease